MPPKTNEEWIAEWKEEWIHCWDDGTPSFAESSAPQGMLDHLLIILTEKDKEREEAVAEAYEKGKAEVLAKWVAQEEFDGPRDL